MDSLLLTFSMKREKHSPTIITENDFIAAIPCFSQNRKFAAVGLHIHIRQFHQRAQHQVCLLYTSLLPLSCPPINRLLRSFRDQPNTSHFHSTVAVSYTHLIQSAAIGEVNIQQCHIKFIFAQRSYRAVKIKNRKDLISIRGCLLYTSRCV